MIQLLSTRFLFHFSCRWRWKKLILISIEICCSRRSNAMITADQKYFFVFIMYARVDRIFSSLWLMHFCVSVRFIPIYDDCNRVSAACAHRWDEMSESKTHRFFLMLQNVRIDALSAFFNSLLHLYEAVAHVLRLPEMHYEWMPNVANSSFSVLFFSSSMHTVHFCWGWSFNNVTHACRRTLSIWISFGNHCKVWLLSVFSQSP